MTIDGLDGRSLRATGSWDGGVLVLDRLSVGDLGGVSVEANLTAFGSFERPELSGTATLKVASAASPAATRFFDAVGAPPALRTGLAASFPADLSLTLGAPSGEGAQTLDAKGTLGPSALDAHAEIASGFLRALGGAFKLRLDLKSADPAAMTAQLGLGGVSLFPEQAPMHLAGVIEGDIGSSLAATLRAEGGGDSLGFSGNVVVTDPDKFTGKGTLKATLADPSALAARLGADGRSLPPIAGTATLEFAGMQSVSLTGIRGTSNGGSFSGQLAFSKPAETGQVSGRIAIAATDAASLVRTLAGPAALLSTGGIWPDGPLATGTAPRATTGRIEVEVPAIALADRSITGASFDFDWDATNTRIRDFTGKLGTGSIGLDLGLCCAGPLSDKQVTGRLGLTQVALDDIVPAAVADVLDGTLNASGRFAATSGSIAGLFGSLTGEGTYTVDKLSVVQLDPKAIAEIAGLDTILEQQPDHLAKLITDRLDDAPFAAPQVTGSFTVAGGVLRSPNLTVTGEGGGLFGSAQLRLADLGLSGSYSITPTAMAPAALVEASAAQVVANLAGTLLAPTATFDVSGLVDAIMVKAYEAEVDRLEKLRAEDEARKQAEAKERAAEEAAARQAAEDAAALRAADEAAARKAAAEAAARKAAEDEARRAQTEALRRAEEEASKPLDLFGN
jgi:hypothetical protein